MYVEDDFIMISALQHYVYCPRQCGLIHVDDVWHENMYTTRGNILHKKVDTNTYETRHGKKTVRGLRIHSFNYGLVGRCDVVEFSENNSLKAVTPVEFKAGEPKDDISDKVQLCAQVICLEEMTDTEISTGIFFYGKIRRREIIDITEDLRNATKKIIEAVRKIITSKKVPKEEYGKKCRNCSLQTICQPKALNKKKTNNYLKGLYAE